MNVWSLLIAVAISTLSLVNGYCPDDDSSIFYKSDDVNAVTKCPIARDCKVWFEAGARNSGIYPIKPDEGDAFQVYCDMETDEGGWTVLMRRQDGSLNFDLNWADYEAGFGNLNGEFWLGLSKMHRLTPEGTNALRIDLGDFEGNSAFAKYSNFEVLDASADYALVISNYTGNAGESLDYHNIARFTTKDNDNDNRGNTNCVNDHPGGGWWFTSCFRTRLTGNYIPGGNNDKDWAGIIWDSWKGKKYSLKLADMKVRRN